VPTVYVNNTIWKGEETKKGEGEFGKFNLSRGEVLNSRGKLTHHAGTDQGNRFLMFRSGRPWFSNSGPVRPGRATFRNHRFNAEGCRPKPQSTPNSILPAGLPTYRKPC